MFHSNYLFIHYNNIPSLLSIWYFIQKAYIQSETVNCVWNVSNIAMICCRSYWRRDGRNAGRYRWGNLGI